MEPELVVRLTQINRAFYEQFAVDFAESRTLAQPSLFRVLEVIPPAGRILDLGCGHGRVAHLLARERPGSDYLGLDFSADFIRLARQGVADLIDITCEFQVVDLLQSDWPAVLQGRRFDIVLLLAVLHHIPGYDNRLAIMRAVGNHLDPGGRLIASAWQFTSNERMRRKIVSWDQVGLDPTGLELGDHLLDWKRGGVGYRYCHEIDINEMARLAAESGHDILETFRADGKEGNLSLFGVMTRSVDEAKVADQAEDPVWS